MGREEQIVSERMRKLNEMRKAGIDPYPEKFEKKQNCAECADSKPGAKVKTGGRLMTKRDLGKIAFCVLKDFSGKVQIVLQEKETPDSERELFKKYADSGDFVGVEGKIIKTKTGEISILVKKLEILSKSVLPLPEKFHGLENEEEKLRKRYLDMIMNREVCEMFLRKSKFWNEIRKFLLNKGFVEVETPVLEESAGGAAATPFKAHHNALDMDVFLRISQGELWQKKLMVAGFEKTFEIGRLFRNEGMDLEHLQDYTSMEFYWAYANYEDGMKLVEEMYKKIIKEVFGKMKFEIHGHEVDFSKKWERYDFEKTIKKYSGLDIYPAGVKEIKRKLKELGVEYRETGDKWKLVDALWKYCRKKISGPGFLTGQPVGLSPLAKRNPADKRKVEQFQVIIAGSEVGNGYSELNDPFDQEERFKEQMKLKELGNEEAMEHDKSFVEALKYGMPPVCGFGVSERLFAFLENRPIRETVIFPLMKPEANKDEKSKNNKKPKNKKRKTIDH